MALPSELISQQIRAVLADIGAGAIKTGMLANADIVSAVAGELRSSDVDKIVVDPVMLSTSGTQLLDDAGVAALIGDLLPIAHIVTPNVEEASALARRSHRLLG